MMIWGVDVGDDGGDEENTLMNAMTKPKYQMLCFSCFPPTLSFSTHFFSYSLLSSHPIPHPPFSPHLPPLFHPILHLFFTPSSTLFSPHPPPPQRATCHPPIFLIVLDTCMEEDDLQAVKVVHLSQSSLFFHTPAPILSQLYLFSHTLVPILSQSSLFSHTPAPILSKLYLFSHTLVPILSQSSLFSHTPVPILSQLYLFSHTLVPILSQSSLFSHTPVPILSQSSLFSHTPVPILSQSSLFSHTPVPILSQSSLFSHTPVPILSQSYLFFYQTEKTFPISIFNSTNHQSKPTNHLSIYLPNLQSPTNPPTHPTNPPSPPTHPPHQPSTTHPTGVPTDVLESASPHSDGGLDHLRTHGADP